MEAIRRIRGGEFAELLHDPKIQLLLEGRDQEYRQVSRDDRLAFADTVNRLCRGTELCKLCKYLERLIDLLDLPIKKWGDVDSNRRPGKQILDVQQRLTQGVNALGSQEVPSLQALIYLRVIQLLSDDASVQLAMQMQDL